MTKTRATTLIALIGLIAVFGFLYFFTGVFGETRISLTLRTNSDLERGLVGHWTFDGKDLIDNATDVSGTGNTGYLVNFTPTTTVPGTIGQALSFDGCSGCDQDDYVVANPSSSLNNLEYMTISAWIYPKSFGAGGMTIVDKDQGSNEGWLFSLDANGRLRFDMNYASPDLVRRGVTIIPFRTWQHVAVTFASTSLASDVHLYLNGIEQSAGLAVDATLPRSDDSARGVRIGRGSAFNSFDGYIDDVRIYNRVLATSSIERLYQLGATTKIAQTLTTNPDLANGLVAHYAFDGDLTNAITDKSTTANSAYFGTTTQATSSMITSGHIGQAVTLDGVDDYIVAPNAAAQNFTSGPSTMSAWFRLTDPLPFNQVGELIYKRTASSYQYVFWVRGASGGALQLFAIPPGSSTNHNTTTFFPSSYTNEWYHVVVTYDEASTNGVFYLNGRVLDTFSDVGGANRTGAGNFVIGSNGTGGGNFNGDIDDVRVYTRALSADEVQRLYELGATTKAAKTLTTNPDLERGLVGHWTFDGNLEDQVADRSVSGNNAYFGTSSRATTSIVHSGTIGQAVEFDGTTDYVNIGTVVANSLADHTYAMWVKSAPNANGGNNGKPLLRFESGSDSSELLLKNLGSFPLFGLWVITGGQIGISQIYNFDPGDSWHHYAITWEDSTNNLITYVDGQNVDQRSMGSTMPGDFTAGYIGTGDSDYFEGTIDDVRIYNRVLSASEIKRLYELGK